MGWDTNVTNAFRGSRTSKLMLLLVVAGAGLGAGCGSPEAEVEVVQGATTTPVPADVLGFESTSGWHVDQGGVASLTTSSTRTKGKSSISFTRPTSRWVLESSDLPNTTAELAKIDFGTSFSMDVLLPKETIPGKIWTGSIELEVQVPSRGIRLASLGIVDVTNVRKGVFTTLHFAIPDTVVTALKGKTYKDFSFWMKFKLVDGSQGPYLLDNLRIKGKLPPRPTSIAQITPGQSILLEPWKEYAPAGSFVDAKTFTSGIVQIPQALHLSKGKVGTGTAKLEYRLGTGTIVTCTYVADPAAAGLGYKLGSCTNANLIAGDLVAADWLRLTVVNGDATAGKTKIKAQIALNPVGDALMAGLPPIPTYFGNSAAEVAAALDAFVQAQRNWQTQGEALVRLPTPAIPSIATTNQNNQPLPPQGPYDNDPPFNLDGRLTNTDMADAGWHVNGAIAAPLGPNGARKTQFDIDIGSDLWILGFKISNVVGITGHLETNTPAFDGQTVPPTTSSGDFCYGYLGVATQCAGPFNGTTGFEKNIADIHPSITLLSQTYWFFHFGAYAKMDLVIDASGGFTPNGFAVTLRPSAGFGVQVEGGLAVGTFGGGGMFANVRLVDIAAPVTASVTATLNASPLACRVHVTETLSGTATLTMGAGAIGYYLEGGLTCGLWSGLCWRTEGNLWDWPGKELVFPILPASPLANQDFSLPFSLCAPVGTADGGVTYPLPGATFKPGDTSFLAAGFERTTVNTGGQLNIPERLTCETQLWTSTDPSDVITPLGGCNYRIRYGSPGTRTLSVSVTDPALGTGADVRQVTVLAGDPATAPQPVITSPAAGTTPGNCASVTGTSTVSDPNGLTTTLEWLEGTFTANSTLTFRPSGTNPTEQLTGGDVIRLTATNSSGQQGSFEIPVYFYCVK